MPTERHYYWSGEAEDGNWNTLGNWRVGGEPGVEAGEAATALPGRDPANYEDRVHFYYAWGDPLAEPPEIVPVACTDGPTAQNAAILALIHGDSSYGEVFTNADIMFANVTTATLTIHGDMKMADGVVTGDADIHCDSLISGGAVHGNVSNQTSQILGGAPGDVTIGGSVTAWGLAAAQGNFTCAGAVTIQASPGHSVPVSGVVAPRASFSGAGLEVADECEIDLLEFSDGEVAARTGKVLNWRSGTITAGGGDITNALAQDLEAPNGVQVGELRIYGSVALDVALSTGLLLLMTREARATDYASEKPLPDARRVPDGLLTL